MLSERALKIVELLTQHKEGISGENLAEYIGVSSRTIRSDMKQISAVLAAAGASLYSTPREGYRLEACDDAFLTQLRMRCGRAVAVSIEDRAYYLIKKLLVNALENREITQTELAEEMFISLSTLKISLKEAEKKLLEYQLRVSAHKNRGIRIDGDEAQIRYCISEYIFNRGTPDAAQPNAFYRGLFQGIDLRQVEAIILRVMAAHEVMLTDEAVQNLLIHTAIAISRARSAHHIAYTARSTRQIEQTIEYQMASALIAELDRQMGIDIAASEIYYITQHLIASKKYSVDEAAASGRQTDGLIQRIIEAVKSTSGIDFSGDETLKKWLRLHLYAAIPRMQFHMNIRNEVLDVVKNEYPLAFQLAVIASRTIEAAEDIRVNENEIGFIAIHFGAALSRKGIAGDAHVKNAIIVCATGIGTAILIKAKLEAVFKNRIRVVKTLPGYQLDAAEIRGVDMVLTTIPVRHIDSDKIIYIAHLLNQSEVDAIEARIYGNRAGKDLPLIFFREACFYQGMQFGDKKAALDFLIGEMIEKGWMNERTKASVWEREDASSTEIGNLVAIPHPMYNALDTSAIAVLVLDKPFIWDVHPVQVIFLMNIAKADFGVWETVFLKLFDYLVKGNGVRQMIKEKSYRAFIRRFLEKFE